MNVLILKTCAAGNQHLEAGSTEEVSESIGKELIRMGRASKATEAPVCPPKQKAKPKKKAVATDDAE